MASSCGLLVFPEVRGGFFPEIYANSPPDYTASHLRRHLSTQLRRPESRNLVSCRVSGCDCLWRICLGWNSLAHRTVHKWLHWEYPMTVCFVKWRASGLVQPATLHCGIYFAWNNHALTFWRRIIFQMWVIQKPNKVALWNKRHFEEEKVEIIQHV